MNIIKQTIDYKHELPCAAELCKISAMEPHYHTHDLEIVYCLEGQVNLVSGHQTVTINEGEIFSIDYRDIHYLHSDIENLVLIFHLNLKNLVQPWEYLQHIFFACESNHCNLYQQKAMEKIKDITLSLSYTLFSDDIDTTAAIRTSNTLMDVLINYFNWYNYDNHDEYINPEIYNRWHRVLAYCNDNYMNKISISHLAEMEHVNANYFSQFIRKTVFRKFSDMISYIRCYEAEHLILTTDLPLAEISYKCGFSDPKYFYAAFKKWWRCTPTEHRNKYRDYITKDFNAHYFKDAKAVDFISKHMTKWMLEKTLKG